MKTKGLSLLLLAALCLLIGSIQPSGLASAEGPAAVILAEKVLPSQLQAGDQLVIVCSAKDMALGQNAVTSARLGGAAVAPCHTATRQVLTSIPDGAAVFELTEAENGWLLSCDAGYLTSSATGSALFYAPDIQDGSLWQFVDDAFLYNPNARYSSGSATYQNYYLEFFSSYFTMYGKRASSDPSPFEMSFYRLGNSRPEEPLLEESYYTLPVFETSDVHGYLANITEDGQTQYLMAYISARVDAARNGRKDRAILLDGGDIYQGMTLSNLTNGHSLSAAYALMDYDAVTVGNHEFDWGLENTVDSDGTMMDYDLSDEWHGVNSTPVVISDLYQSGSKVPWGRDYILLEKTAVDPGGHELPVKIAVIGVAGEYGSSIMAERFSGAGYSIRLDYDEVNALAQQLEQSGACDATILLAHESASAIAGGLGDDTPIDLVLGGHTHYTVNDKTQGGLRYMEPSCYGKAYARANLVFSSEDGEPRFEHIAGSQVVSVPTSGIGAEQLDQRIVALTDDVVEMISELLETRVGTITVSALRRETLPGSGDRSSTCGNWVGSILARIYEADAAFVNSGGLRADLEVDARKGERDITRSDVYTMFPFDNKVYLFELTYEDLLRALEYALTASGKTLLSEVWGVTCYTSDGAVTAILSPDGIPVYVNGAWRNDWRTRTLRVSTSEFIVTTDRPQGDLSNPFCEWQNTERLLAFDRIDNVSAIEVLEAESAANNGYLAIDTAPHFISGTPSPDGSVCLLPEGIAAIEAEAFMNSGIQVLVVPEGCTSIQAGAFSGCALLREVFLPRDCAVDPSAFANCPQLTAIYAPAGGTAEAFAAGFLDHGDGSADR